MAKKFCGNCFSTYRGGVCPKCGFTERHSGADYDAMPAGTRLNGRYTVGRVLGRGGFGITYLAYDEKSEKTVAVKEFYPDSAAARLSDNISVEPMTEQQTELYRKGLERFLNEAEIIAGFSESSEILGVFDVFRANGTAYYSMEFVKGVPLKRFVEQNGIITEGQAVGIAEKLLPALEVIHSAGTLHRDVCPDNIMLCANGAVRLIDFGSARLTDEKTQSMSVILKPGFAPLEQYRRRGHQDGRTDIYSLGATLYFALTAETPEDPLTRLDSDDFFGYKLKDVSPGLSRIIKKAAAVRAEDRFSDAAEMLKAVKNCGTAAEEFSAEALYASANAPDAKSVPDTRRRTVTSAVISAAFRVSDAARSAVGGMIGSGRDIKVKICGEMYPLDTVSLDLSGRRINHSQISNIRHLKNLVYLNLNDNYILELSCLKGLTKLEYLYFNNNNINDISFLRGMDNLKLISGENSSVSDLSELSDKTELESVYFGNSLITDISPIKNCSKLREVGFVETPIGEIEALRGKPLLEKVCLSGCGITDISPLSDSKRLKYIYLGRNCVSDLSPLAGCEPEELYLDGNDLAGHAETFRGIKLAGFAAMERNDLSEEEKRLIRSLLGSEGKVYFDRKEEFI